LPLTFGEWMSAPGRDLPAAEQKSASAASANLSLPPDWRGTWR
jgi:hypothetical protein